LLPRPPTHLHRPSFPTRRSSDLSRYHFRGQPLPEHALELLRKRIDGTLGFAQVRIGGTLAAITRATITTTASGRSFLGYSAVERSEEHTSELQSRFDLVCRLLLE